MSSYDELKQEALTNRGVLTEITARVRAEVFDVIDGQEFSRPTPARESRLVNELIREYMQSNGYMHSLSVFTTESHLPKSTPSRTKLSQDLYIDPADYPDDVPLLYGLALKNLPPDTKSVSRQGEKRKEKEAGVDQEEDENEILDISK
ncbi:hypothetical protein HK097_001209 [Rhizophlyctis rosea]|uniref:Centrosomal protein 43 n=1 Tax=Rhizophlyctis rosea TaxID=64517 RepID=A0AAD5X3I9_9FUNG|nr:hypothetical protein HK097_001209 [Rhizophlyctis rosea]